MKKLKILGKNLLLKIIGLGRYKMYFLIAVNLGLVIICGFMSYNSAEKNNQNKDLDLQAAYVKIEEGNSEEAIKILEGLYLVNKSDTELAKRLAEYYFRGKKYLEFETLVNRYDFQDGQIYTMLAYVSRSNGDQEKTLEYYKKAIEIQPRYATFYVNLANYYLVINQPQNALDTVKQGLNNNPKSSILNLLASNCALSLGDKKLAKDYAQTVLDYDKDNKRALEILSMK